ncbi:AraC-type DNA-binding protein [Spirosomataceae bacterium TFI 002]|nr:AraC-type DNA-binding protein [Spirosomataceae bacterium TFI 002]
MEINSVKTVKIPLLDGIELKSATFIDKSFPLHFHQNWSLAYIEKGSENISFVSSSFLLNKSALILIPPHSLHKNWGNKHSSWTYKALYLSNDVIKDVAHKLQLDYNFVCSFPYFVSYDEGTFEPTENCIFNNLEKLFTGAILQENEHNKTIKKQAYVDDLLHHLHTNYNATITLDSLEKQFKVNKFKLLKVFKKRIGLSPLEYQTAIRIENSKQLFYEDISLTEIALESGYYDQSHFTHSFKKYVGVTPGAYKQNSNILQDY